jgi:hypothetical protein
MTVMKRARKKEQDKTIEKYYAIQKTVQKRKANDTTFEQI